MLTHKIQSWYYRCLDKSERGQTMTEYSLILALVAIVGLTTWALLGTNITSTVSKVASCI
jgi:Flp pilus assembly pilin Flp